jgi:hypothetical protein
MFMFGYDKYQKKICGEINHKLSPHNFNLVRPQNIDHIHVGITWPKWVVKRTWSTMDASTLITWGGGKGESSYTSVPLIHPTYKVDGSSTPTTLDGRAPPPKANPPNSEPPRNWGRPAREHETKCYPLRGLASTSDVCRGQVSCSRVWGCPRNLTLEEHP